MQSINDDYNRQLLQLERQRLDRLGQLAARQSPKEAAETYEQLFRLAIANNLFREAEPAAERSLEIRQRSPPVVQFLAQTIDIIASADRGAYDESLADLRTLIDTSSNRQSTGRRPGSLARHVRPAGDLRGLLPAAPPGRPVRRGAESLSTAAQGVRQPGRQGVLRHRLNQLDMIGKPAPAIQGTDLDGKPVDLADSRATSSWSSSGQAGACPAPPRSPGSIRSTARYQDRGFRIVGINVDTLQNDGPKLETVMPNIRRFLLDHNVRWPNLINGTGHERLRQGLRRHRDPDQRPDRTRRHRHPPRPVAQQEPRSGRRRAVAPLSRAGHGIEAAARSARRNGLRARHDRVGSTRSVAGGTGGRRRIDRLGQRLVERQQEQVEGVGDARGLVGSHILQGRAGRSRAVSGGRRSPWRSTRRRSSSISARTAWLAWSKASRFSFRSPAIGASAGQTSWSLRVVEAGQGQRSASAAARSSPSGSSRLGTAGRSDSDSTTGSRRSTS